MARTDPELTAIKKATPVAHMLNSDALPRADQYKKLASVFNALSKVEDRSALDFAFHAEVMPRPEQCKALAGACNALANLPDDAARKRVLQYAMRRNGVSAATTPAQHAAE